MITALATAVLLGAPLHLDQPVERTAVDTPTAEAGDPGPGRRALRIDRAAGPIRIDGELGDAGWERAARVTDFTEFQPGENVAPPVETEALVTYSDTHLYLAFIAHDPEPARIRATLRGRNQLWSDDFVGIILDPHGDQSLGYMFFVNPLGVQGDMQVTAQGEDPSIDFVFESAGRITDSGYVVEMAIPFSSIRFPSRDVQSWRITFARNYPRSSRHMMSWAPISQNNPCMLCQLGTLEGIEGIRSGGTLEILPSVVASQAGRLASAGDPASWENGRVTASASLGVKYVFRNGWMAEGTLYPDFSQVESDAAQVDVNTTFALFYPERRPFFQEGMDLYETRMNVFYSRSINAPQVAGRVSGRAGSTSVGYIVARDEHTPFILPFEERSAVVQAGPSITNVVRVRHNLYGDSYVGGLLTDRRLEGGGSGTTASVDAAFRFGDVYRFSAHAVMSHTREPDDPELSAAIPNLTFGRGEDEHTAAFDGESFTGHGVSARISRDARVWSWNANYLEASPTYRAETGFQSRNDFRRLSGWTGLTFRPDRLGVERLSTGLGGGSTWNFGGDGKDAWLSPSVNLTLPLQTQVGVNASFRRETFRGVEMDGIRRYGLFLNSEFSDAATFGFSAGAGTGVARMLATPEVGPARDANVWATLKPVQRLVIEPSIGYARMDRADGDELFAGYIARTRVSFQLNRELQIRTVFQYNDFADRIDVEPLVIYQINPFTMFYVGSTHGSHEFDELGYRATDRQYFAKFQYLFRR